jgi:hypothetical protein
MFYSIDMIELLLPCGFDTLEYSWVKATISNCMLADYIVAKKRQHGVVAAILQGKRQLGDVSLLVGNLGCMRAVVEAA